MCIKNPSGRADIRTYTQGPFLHQFKNVLGYRMAYSTKIEMNDGEI